MATDTQCKEIEVDVDCGVFIAHVTATRETSKGDGYETPDMEDIEWSLDSLWEIDEHGNRIPVKTQDAPAEVRGFLHSEIHETDFFD